MVIKKKAIINKTPNHMIDSDREKAINDFINRGGKTSEENEPKPKKEKTANILLRLPKKLVDQIDRACKKRLAYVTRTQWIIEVLAEKLGAE